MNVMRSNIIIAIALTTSILSNVIYSSAHKKVDENQLRQLQRKTRQLETPGRLPDIYESITLNTTVGGCSGYQNAILDIYRSRSSKSVTVLHLPGGAYMNLIGDTVESAGQEYLDEGYTLAVLYYRLPRSPDNMPWLVCSDPHEALEDLEAAMIFLRNNHEEYHVDPEAIVTSGFSAGGHLAALYGTTCGVEYCPNAMVLHFPFLETGSKIFCTDVGSAFKNNLQYEHCHPTALVDGNTPPTIIYHASGDTIVSTQEIVDFSNVLSESGVAHEYYEVPGGGHFMVPFNQVASVSGGVFNADDGYSSFIRNAILLVDSVPIGAPSDTFPPTSTSTYLTSSVSSSAPSAAPPNTSCVQCNNKETKWMADNGKTCEVGSDWFIQNRCASDSFWVREQYCRKSCYDAGRGYEGDVCCTNECNPCDDKPPSWTADCSFVTSGEVSYKCSNSAWWINNRFCRRTCADIGLGYEEDNCCLDGLVL